MLDPDQESVVSSARGRSEPTKAKTGDFQVGPGTLLTLGYRAFDEEGEQVAESEQNGVDVVFGYGQLLPRLEQALAGLMPGDERDVELEPADAYGEWDQRAVLEIDPTEFPAETSPGDEFEAENPDGVVLLFKVLDVTPDAVLLDTNHPLAGQRVRFALEVRAVRPATEEELRVAADRALANSESPPSPELVAPGRLLPHGRGR